MSCAYSLHFTERRGNLAAFIRKLRYPKSLFIFTYIRRQDGYFISSRKLRELLFHRFHDFRSLEETTRAVITQIQDQDQCEWLARLSFTREVREGPQFTVVEYLEIFLNKIRNRQTCFLVFDESIKKNNSGLDPNRVFNFLSSC